MTLGRSHVLREHTRREAYASVLVEWLNNTSSEQARSRIVEIIELFRNLDKFGRLDLPRVRLGRWSKLRPTKVQAENAVRLGLITNRLHADLERYRFSPARQSKEGGWAFRWKHSHRAGAVDIVVSRSGDTIRVAEGDAVIRLLRIIEDGYLQRLQKCHFCDNWLYVRFKHQLYCRKNCQLSAYKTTNSWRAKRMKYMREYRELKASGKVR